jgi:hypothetical protein
MNAGQKYEENTMANPRGSRKLFAIAASLAVIILLAISLALAQAQQVVGYRAGTNTFVAPGAGITVTFSAPMPTDKYSVILQPNNTSGYSTTPNCTYFNVLKKTKAGFQVQHKRCDTGAVVSLKVNVPIDWIAWSYN